MSAQLFPRLHHADDRLAFDVDGRSVSYRSFAQLAAAHADSVRDLTPGAHVGVWTFGAIETLAALVGNACAGLVSVPLNPKLGSAELAHILEDAAPVRTFAAEVAAVRDRDETVLEVARAPSSSALPVRGLDGPPLLLLYTSGTTGRPKGALLGAAAVAANLDALADAWAWTDADEVVHALPLFHVHGLVLGAFGSLRVGGGLRHVSRFTPESVAHQLAQATMLFAVPTMIRRLAESAEQDSNVCDALRGARLLVSGSAGLPVREHRRIEALTGRGVHERYGLTETLINCAVRADEGPKPGTVGRPLRGVELRLVDDARRPCEGTLDAPAEVAVRGPSCFEGYLNRPEATAEVRDADGWFYTGDLAARTEDGAIRILGRRSVDLIKTGGYKVGAGEVEACLLEHPAIAEVAVVGAPDEDLGQRILAFVVLREHAERPEAASLTDRVAAELTPHKRPREVRFVDALPRNAMGKVQKRRLLEP